MADNSSTNQGSSFDNITRQYLTLAIAVFSIIGVILLGFASVHYAPKEDNGETMKYVFGVLLPLIGTWMGTVIAFYFSKDNFEAASKSANEMMAHVISQNEKLEEVRVLDVMVKPATFAFMFVKDKETFYASKLKDLIQKMVDLQTERLPVLYDEKKTLLFLIYRTTLERFISGFSNGSIKVPGKDTIDATIINELILKDMFTSDFKLIKDIENIAEKGGCFLPNSATLAEARQLMLDNTFCQDVFITKTGNKDEAIEGWVTNEMVIEKSELFKRAQTKR